MSDPPDYHLTAGGPVSQPGPFDPNTAPTPEPLVSAEIIRTVVVALIAAAGAAPLADGALAVVVPIVTAGVGALLSWGLTAITRGKVWAIRHGVNVDEVVDELQRRTQ